MSLPVFPHYSDVSPIEARARKSAVLPIEPLQCRVGSASFSNRSKTRRSANEIVIYWTPVRTRMAFLSQDMTPSSLRSSKLNRERNKQPRKENPWRVLKKSAFPLFFLPWHTNTQDRTETSRFYCGICKRLGPLRQPRFSDSGLQ